MPWSNILNNYFKYTFLDSYNDIDGIFEEELTSALKFIHCDPDEKVAYCQILFWHGV